MCFGCNLDELDGFHNNHKKKYNVVSGQFLMYVYWCCSCFTVGVSIRNRLMIIIIMMMMMIMRVIMMMMIMITIVIVIMMIIVIMMMIMMLAQYQIIHIGMRSVHVFHCCVILNVNFVSISHTFSLVMITWIGGQNHLNRPISHIPQCSIRNRNVHISVLNGAFRDMEQVHSGIVN